MTSDNFMVIDFDPSGAASAMHRDSFSLGFLGKQEIKRASEIKFNESTQKWDVYLPTGAQVHDADAWFAAAPACGFNKYDTARKFEVLWLEHCALQSIAPLDPKGISLAQELRFEFDKTC